MTSEIDHVDTENAATGSRGELSIESQALLDALARAMAMLSTTRRQFWPNRTGEMYMEPSMNCPTLHQLLIIKSHNQTLGHMQSRGTSLAETLALEHVHALHAAALCTECGRVAQQLCRTDNFDLRPMYESVMYEKMIERGDEPYRAGGIRHRLQMMCFDAARNWMSRLGNCVAFCIAQERGEGLQLLPSEELLDDLTLRLVHRQVGASPSDNGDDDPLSPQALQRLVDKHARVSVTLARQAKEEACDTLRWLVELCESPRDSVRFRQCISESTELLNGGLCALSRVTRLADSPSELRSELQRLGPAAGSEDVLNTLALALGYKSELRVMNVGTWHDRHARALCIAARRALHKVLSTHPPPPPEFTPNAPFVSMVRPISHDMQTNSDIVVALPLPQHVFTSARYGLSKPCLLLAYERLGLTPEQILSNCIIDVIWELIGTYGELPPLTVSSRIATFTFEVARHEAELVIDMIAQEIVNSGSFVTQLVDNMRGEMSLSDGEFENTVAKASYTLGSFSMEQIMMIVDTIGPSEQLYRELVARLQAYMGRRPVRNAYIPTRLLINMGLLEHETPFTNTAREDEPFLSMIYHPRIVFELLGNVLPSVYSLRRRAHLKQTMLGIQSTGLLGVDAATLSVLQCGLSTVAYAREWFQNLIPRDDGPKDSTDLLLFQSTLHDLPPECVQILTALVDRKILRWQTNRFNRSDRIQRIKTLHVPRALFTSIVE